MIAWHCCHTRPQQETRAAIELTNQDFRVFLPVLASKPMFPRYLFIQFDRQIDPWGVIKNTRGCSGLLLDGFMPAIVPDRAIEAIMAYREPEKPQDGQTEFTPGQPVRIVSGPCAGIEGLFVADANRRVYALLEICGKQIKVARESIRAA